MAGKSLFRMTDELRTVLEGGIVFDEETGEITADLDDLKALQVATEDKLDGCVDWIRHLDASIEEHKTEEERLRRRRKGLEAAKERYRAYMLASVKMLPDQRMRTAFNDVSVRHTKSVQVLDQDAVPDGYMRVKIEASPNKKEIREALLNGEEVPGCALVVNESLSVR